MLNTHYRFAIVAVVLALAAISAIFAAWVFSRSSVSVQDVIQQIIPTDSSGDDSDSDSDLDSDGSSDASLKTTLFATMLAFNTNEGLRGVPNGPQLLTEGWSTILADSKSYTKFFSQLERAFEKNVALVEETGFSSNRDVVASFVWNVIEPTKGTYDWTIPDLTAKSAGAADIKISGVMQPFVNWDQTDITAEEYKEKCSAIDFGYYDFKAGQVSDWEAFEKFLTATVERYDGDGKNDMPGLTTRVEAWEIGNEIEGSCGGFSGDPEGYIELLSASYRIIKEADPTAIVLNGGALEVLGFDGQKTREIGEFWESFFALGGDQYLDVFNFHHNHERGGADETPDRWVRTLEFFNELMADSDGKKPLWVTEFGTYSGTPSAPGRPGGPPGSGQALATQSAEFQASWYFRYSVIGFANGLERIFMDLKGDDKAGIGASSLYNDGPGKDGVPRAFLATLQGMSQIIDGFDSVKDIADGQYLFNVDDRDVYALWDGQLPGPLAGKSLVVMGLDGEEQTLEADDLIYSEEAPVLVFVD